MDLNKPNKPLFKVKVKVTVPYPHNPKKGRKEWAHFAYVSTNLYVRYMTIVANPLLSERRNVQESISRWFEEDFKRPMELETYDELINCRRTVMESMKPEFPDIYQDDYAVDRQGWVKLWLARHMREDLRRVDNDNKKQYVKATKDTSSRL